MMTFILVLHAIICALLIGMILVQAGRGGGLVQGFSGVESMFGTRTNTFLTRTTTVLAVMFFITCLSLAFLSARQGKSLLDRVKTKPKPSVTTQEVPKTQEAIETQEALKPQETPKPETAKTN